ncbi:hypothetical protein [Tunturiibacter lichenicola]|uniref:hypothetical protein n=1 Tax=Tunturiibacter lichenicola TaxID=2051959 RepID=UPI003D9B4942
MRDFPLKTQMRPPAGGVYYNATHMEAQMCDSEEVIVVGGGNSASRAAVSPCHMNM